MFGFCPKRSSNVFDFRVHGVDILGWYGGCIVSVALKHLERVEENVSLSEVGSSLCTGTGMWRIIDILVIGGLL